MSTECAFLDQLAADPADEVTRLVYADWLEDHNDSRAAFLRAEQELAALDKEDPRLSELDALLCEQVRSLRWDWVAVVGRRWDVWLESFPPVRKIITIKALRDLTNCSLREGKQTVEAAPLPVLRSCTWPEAVIARRHFGFTFPSNDPLAEARIVASTQPQRSAAFQCARWYEVVYVNHRPGMRHEAQDALTEGLNFLPPQTNSVIFHCPTEEAAQTAAAPFHSVAFMEVRPGGGECRDISVPIFHVAESGPFAVWLLSYPPENAQRIREVIAGTSGFSVQPPVVLSRGVSGAQAERLRRLLAEWCEVEVRDQRKSV